MAQFLHWGDEDSDFFPVGLAGLDFTTIPINTTANATIGDQTLVFASTTGIAPRNWVIGTNIPWGTYVTGVTPTTVTLNTGITGNISSGSTITFYPRFDPLVSYGLSVPVQAGGGSLANFWRTIGQFNSSSIMVTAKMWASTNPTFISTFTGSTFIIRLLDVHGLPRLGIGNVGVPAVGIGGPWGLLQFADNGSITQIGSSFVGFQGNALQRISFGVIGGNAIVKINGAVIIKEPYSGNAFQGYDLGVPTSPGGTGTAVWSSIVAADFDCDSIVPTKVFITGAGASSDWAGASDGSTVNELELNITDGIASDTPNQVELFATSVQEPAGSWNIVGLGVAAFTSASPFGTVLATSADTASGSTLHFTSTAEVVDGQGVSGSNIPADTTVVSHVVDTSVTISNPVSGDVPTGSFITFHTPLHMQIALRIGGTNYFSPTLLQDLITNGKIDPIAPALDRVAYSFVTSPATNQLFTSAEISSIQVGLKSIG